MENGFLKKAKQGLMGFRELKTKSGLRKLILSKSRFWGEKERRKGEKSKGLKKIKFWLGFFPFSCSFVIKQLRSGDLKRLR